MKLLFSKLLPILSILLLASSCNSCVTINADNDTFIGNGAASSYSRQRLIRYIARRAVHIEMYCKITKYESLGVYTTRYKRCWWGSGTIIYSSKEYSLVQTAAHVVESKIDYDFSDGTIIETHRLDVNRYNLRGDLVESHMGAEVFEVSKSADIAVIKVKGDLGVSSTIAEKTVLGEDVMYVGFPGISGRNIHLSVSIGYIGTVKVKAGYKKGKVSRGVMYIAGGSSGSAIFNMRGEIVGIVSYSSGYRFGSAFISKLGDSYFVDCSELRKFYRSKELRKIINQR